MGKKIQAVLQPYSGNLWPLLRALPGLAKAAFRIHFHVEVSTLQMPRMLSDGFCCRWQLSINFVMTISCRSSSGREEESES